MNKVIKSVSTNQVINSDRVEMVNAANTLVNTITAKQLAPFFSTAMAEPLELSPTESAAYEASLAYLARQFQVGHRDSEVVTVSLDRSVEESGRPQEGERPGIGAWTT